MDEQLIIVADDDLVFDRVFEIALNVYVRSLAGDSRAILGFPDQPDLGACLLPFCFS